MTPSAPPGPVGEPPPPRFTLVTPCFNAAARIEATMLSVLESHGVLSGHVTVDYRIQDGGSQDGTVDLARALAQRYHGRGGLRVTVESLPDRGMYQALARGLGASCGELVGYLNAGDYYSPHALEVVDRLMRRPGVDWLTGMQVRYTEAGWLVAATLPPGYDQGLIRRGAYGRRLNFIQQESTFWRRSLHDLVDWERLAGYRRAGDLYLWSCLARRVPLTVAGVWLGGFKVHAGALSADQGAYWAEAEDFLEPAAPLDALRCLGERLAWYLPPRWKKRRNSRHLLLFDHQRDDFV
ncbi:MAG: glycosyltransferase [Magnetococcus sp. WYHC-3]